ncbi:MAG: serine hydrolase [Chitinophagaceae bacterium]|nr:serine hydrolase [Chitinophagaceae bacterium]
MLRLLLISIILLFVSDIAFTQPSGAGNQKLITAFDSIMKKEFKPNEPGASVIVVKKGEVLYKKGFGMADMELNVPVNADMIFRLGSITKQFTALAIMQLADKGKLSLSDLLTKYIPDYAIKEPITIEQLLNHTSGIKSYTNVDSFWAQMRTDLTPRQIIKLTEKDTLEFKPGTKWNYNNTGYVILGYIIEKVAGISYETYVQQNLFAPAGMKNSYYGNESKIIKNRAKGYKKNGTEFQISDYISMTLPYAAGSLISTVEDLWKWNKALYSYQLVKKEWVDKAITPYVLPDGSSTGYGFGLSVANVQGSKSIEHGGGIPGFLTDGIYLPGEQVFVAVFSNCDCKRPDAVTTKLAAIAIGKPYNYKALPITEADAKQFEGVYINKNEERIIKWKEGKLTSQRSGGNLFTINMYAKDKFFFDDSFSFIEFTRNTKGVIEGLKFKSRTEEVTWSKSDKPLPSEKKIVTVAPEILKDYVGAYQLAPNFIITITLEENQLYGQATGQSKLLLQPISNTRFKVKDVEAEVEFKQNAEGKTESLALHQGGREVPGKKQ